MKTTNQNFPFVPLRYNKTFKIGGKSFFFKNYFAWGLRFVGDLLNQNSNFYFLDTFLQNQNVRKKLKELLVVLSLQ